MQQTVMDLMQKEPAAGSVVAQNNGSDESEVQEHAYPDSESLSYIP